MFDPFGLAWIEWTITAQQHMEKGDFGKYWPGNQDDICNMQYICYNLNFLVIWGSSVQLREISPDDEGDMTVTIPFELKKPCVIDTHAIVAHFSFFTVKQLEATDLLESHLLYTKEMICLPNNQKTLIA